MDAKGLRQGGISFQHQDRPVLYALLPVSLGCGDSRRHHDDAIVFLSRSRALSEPDRGEYLRPGAGVVANDLEGEGRAAGEYRNGGQTNE